MCDGTGTKTCLIGKNTSGNTFFHTHEKASYYTACHRCRIKCPSDDSAENTRNIFPVDDNYTDGKNNIKQCHKRYQLFCNLADPFDSAKQDHCHKNRKDDPHNKVYRRSVVCSDHIVIDQCRINSCCNGINLSCISGSENSKHTESGKQIRQPVPVFLKTILNVIHWSSNQISVGIGFAEMYSECNLGKLRTHSKKCGNPHPEHGTRSSDGNGTCNTCNISGSHGSSQCGTNSLKRCQTSIGSFSFPKHTSDSDPDGIGEFPDLEKICTNT